MNRVFELRTYHCNPGRRDDLENRFRDHTLGLFARHGIRADAFFRDQADADSLVYVISYEGGREGAAAAWAAFQADPEWQSAKAASEVDGALVASIDQVFMDATEYSALS